MMHRLESMESSLAAITEALKRLGPPAAKMKYCFHHGTGVHHYGTSCGVMTNDSNFTQAMLKATKKCTLTGNDGKSYTGAD